jgi:hypothetical protein
MRKIRLELAQDLQLKQREHDEAAANATKVENSRILEHKTQTLITKQVQSARRLAEAKANYNGSHAYLGGDVRIRDYHSDWFPADDFPTSDLQQVILELQITRVNDVIRNSSGIETGTNFRMACINMRLRDVERDILSHEDKDVVVFSADGILLEEDGHLIRVLPGDDNWEDVRELLQAIESAD